MPERYTLTTAPEQLGIRFKADLHNAYQPSYNAGPAQLHPVITALSPEGFSFFYFGTIPGWAGNKSISTRLLEVNAKDLMHKPSLKKLLQTQRCLIPADGFFIWKKVGKKSRVPYRFVMKDRGVFAIAGLLLTSIPLPRSRAYRT